MELNNVSIVCSYSHYWATKVFHELIGEGEFKDTPYCKVFSETMDKVFTGEIKRLVINIPPGTAKTIRAGVISSIRAFTISPRARVLYLSGSDDLALNMSSMVRDCMTSHIFKSMYPNIQFKSDSNAKGLWKTTDGGQMRASSIFGQVTGFRAGRLDEGYYGHIVIDDPIKPADMDSVIKRQRVNKAITRIIGSRAQGEAPIIIIMQRVSEDDLSNHVLTGGTGEKWHHLELPAIINNDVSYPDKYTHGIPIKHNLPDGLLWPNNPSLNQEALENLRQADLMTYSSQYMQRPNKGGDLMIDCEKVFDFYDLLPAKIKRFTIFGDTASKTGKKNDYSVFGLCGLVEDGDKKGIYIIDWVRGKWGINDLYEVAKAFVQKYKFIRGLGLNRAGVQKMYVEDASSGTGLIQMLQQDRIKALPTPKKKLKKATQVQMALSKLHRNGWHVYLPVGDFIGINGATIKNPFTNGDFADDLIKECEEFTENDTHAHDDQVDVIADMINHV